MRPQRLRAPLDAGVRVAPSERGRDRDVPFNRAFREVGDRRIEGRQGRDGHDPTPGKKPIAGYFSILVRIQAAFEQAGILFTDDDEAGGIGVRMAKNKPRR